MKALLSAAVFFVCVQSYACPNLTGKWNCVSSPDNTQSVIAVTQQNIPHGVLYHIADNTGDAPQDFPADGASHTMSNNGLTGTLMATCTAANGITAIETFADPAYNLTGKANISLTLSNPKKLVTQMNSHFVMVGQPPQDQSSSSVCTLE